MKIRQLTGLGSAILLFFTVMFSAPLMAEDKPFAQHKFVLQISDMDPFKQTLVLNVASNILKHYGQDNAEVEIVAFGPGVRLLFEGNNNSGRIKSLSENSVRFFACSNTVTNMSKKLGHPLAVNPIAASGTGGIVRIKKLIDEGYTLVKP
jgi:intracellular sulfur oxidation DsrE/DsrF family protein